MELTSECIDLVYISHDNLVESNITSLYDVYLQWCTNILATKISQNENKAKYLLIP